MDKIKMIPSDANKTAAVRDMKLHEKIGFEFGVMNTVSSLVARLHLMTDMRWEQHRDKELNRFIICRIK